MSSLVLSVLLSLFSAVAYATGAIVQERVAATGGRRAFAPLRNGAWWGAVAFNGAGAVLHVVALAYGPLSLVQPLGALTIVFALPMAALLVGRGAGRTAWRGAVMATAGLAGLLALTGGAGSHALSGPDRFALVVGSFGAVTALLLLSVSLRRTVPRSMTLAAGAGVAFGMASVFTKTVAVEWTTGAVGSGLPALLVIAGLATAGLLLSQAAYRGAGLTAPLAMVTVVNPVVAAAVGITFFGEQFRFATTGALVALACGALAAAGLVLLTRERVGHDRAPAPVDASQAEGDGPAGDAEKGTGVIVPPGPATPLISPAPGSSGTIPAPSLPLTMPLEHSGGRVDFGAKATGPTAGGLVRR
ncbi:DMT family transporter [Streptomyces sp. NBC_01754]|uniref:DMT family transporter n=1 Tax=Streptomyces sp. NBC_01754 TaxID=2975930 RepID=UPI002DDC1110|nr:DMT family transporter [Streptomyces sp. NBC_01754]WSC96303.1 DMT family transporter [Streptomyces sp. NBC_01754]